MRGACSIQHSAHYWRNDIRLLPGVRAGSIPEDLGDLVELEELHLDDNKLTGTGSATHVC